MACFVNGFANRALAFDEKRFIAHSCGQPFAVSKVVQATALAFEFLQEHILVIAHSHAHAPCYLAIEPGKQRRQTGNRGAGGLIFWCADLHIAPRRRHTDGLVNVVGQQAFAAAAALRANRPVTACCDSGQTQLSHLLNGLGEATQTLQLAAQAQALEFVGFARWQGFIGVGWRQPRQFIGADFLRQQQRIEFFLQIDRHAEVQQAENQCAVLRFPVFGFIAGLRQIGRELVAVAEQIGVDPAGVHLEKLFEPRRRAFIEFGGVLFQIDAAHQAIGFQCIGTVQLGQATLGQQAQAYHLADTVAGVHVTQGEQGVMETAAFNQRHALCVAANRYILCEPFKWLHT